ncbi:MAG: hypothetical protein ACYCY8_09385 [Burkholderiales bacterium]
MKTVSSAVSKDPAKQKVVFVVTDSLENSSVTSFYVRHGVRRIDPTKEMEKAESNHVIGNFGGASVDKVDERLKRIERRLDLVEA